MKAMVMTGVKAVEPGAALLTPVELPKPEPGAGELLVKVHCCAVCHTELDEIEGRTPPPSYPMVPGHQVVGDVVAVGEGVESQLIGARVGVAWIFSACGDCEFCQRGDENLCADFKATGRDANGGYAEYMVVPKAYAFVIPEGLSSYHAAPLLCAGAIGYRSMRLTGLENGQRLGLTGFGASAHLVLKMVRHRYPDSDVYVFARSQKERDFALELGAVWAGDAGDQPPQKLHAIIDTTPVWRPIVKAMDCLLPGGRLVVNAIRKEEVDKDALLALDYPRDLWLEKEIKSVANVSRRDVSEFLALAAAIPLHPEYQLYPLAQANQALVELKTAAVRGAKILTVTDTFHQ